MNIILSCAADKRGSKGSFIIYKGGKRVVENSFPIYNKNEEDLLKSYIFESLIKGLRTVRSLVSHEDLLLVELSNNHMVEWMNGLKEYKGYSKYLDEIYDIVDSLDCRYLFTKTDVKEAKKLLLKKNKENLEGIDSVFDGI